MNRRRALLIVSAALVTATPTAAVAATTLGSSGAPSGGCNGTDPVEVIQKQRANGAKDAAPAPGVITSWTFDQGAGESVVTLRVYRPTATANQYVVMAEDGAPRTLAANSGAHTFPTRTLISPGDTIGLRVASGTCLSTTSSTVDQLLIKPGEPTAVGGTATFPIASSGTNILVTANVEPDTDQDRYGDETQDKCPGIYGGQPCPRADTVITKKPRKLSHRATSKVFFTATAPVSTFICQLDKRSTKGCTSPAVFTCLRPGKHELRIYAINHAGTPGSPFTATWRVREPRRGC